MFFFNISREFLISAANVLRIATTLSVGPPFGDFGDLSASSKNTHYFIKRTKTEISLVFSYSQSRKIVWAVNEMILHTFPFDPRISSTSQDIRGEMNAKSRRQLKIPRFKFNSVTTGGGEADETRKLLTYYQGKK